MKIGFTGTRNGMTDAQKQALRNLIGPLVDSCYGWAEIHRGDCVGADAECHAILSEHFSCWIVGHPPTNAAMRANCRCDATREPLPYLERNRAIVDECDLLIAAPAEAVEQQRSGTWSTVRYARRQAKRVYLIRPDGTIFETGEQP